MTTFTSAYKDRGGRIRPFDIITKDRDVVVAMWKMILEFPKSKTRTKILRKFSRQCKLAGVKVQ